MVQTNNESGITRTLGNFARELEYEDLSPEVIDWAKYLCLDFAAVTLNGSTTDSAKAAVDALNRLGRPGPIGHCGYAAPGTARVRFMANGIAFHSIELDDVNNEASLHPGVVAFPTALSMADLAHVSGRDFIAAVVAGYDVIVRLGRALQPAEHYGRGFHPTGTCGAFGAAVVVAGRLLGLQGDDFIHALGIAGSQTAGSMEYLAQGAWTKRLHPGWGFAQRLVGGAAGAVRGTPGRPRYWRAGMGSCRPIRAILTIPWYCRTLVREYLITRTGIKPTCLLPLQAGSDRLPHRPKEHPWARSRGCRRSDRWGFERAASSWSPPPRRTKPTQRRWLTCSFPCPSAPPWRWPTGGRRCRSTLRVYLNCRKSVGSCTRSSA